METLDFFSREIPLFSFNTIIVGSGCSALNGADTLYDLGVRDIAIVTEGMKMGTSRNTGSDKQTYYKLSLSGADPDSVADMAETLYGGECIQGETALVQAALSTRCFFKLVNMGVPFPHDEFGQYVGYRTDHDASQRATSCGPLTSRKMTERLESAVREKKIRVFDGYRIVRLLTKEKDGEKSIAGAVAVQADSGGQELRFILFECENVIYATGGPSAVYFSKVYPESQTGSHGAALLCGAKACNVTEWQYGIASTKFRWNLSGSYQQVLPRYFSAGPDGEDPKEFLRDYFASPEEMLTAEFLKGYQWPFDPRKLSRGGSSLIDLALFVETKIRGRRVFLDYTQNPSAAAQRDGTFDFSLLSEEAYSYLKKSEVLFGTPVRRLMKMNRPAYELYRDHGIDLAKEPVEAAVCAQHNNGGLCAGLWWESNIKGLFPVGEACGDFGVYRPGGTALNATQVDSLRAAQYIRAKRSGLCHDRPEFLAATKKELSGLFELCGRIRSKSSQKKDYRVLRAKYQREMDECGMMIRSEEKISRQIEKCRGYLENLGLDTEADSPEELREALINQDILITQIVYLTGMLEYIRSGGKSRGSYLIQREELDLSSCKNDGIPVQLDNGAKKDVIQKVWLREGKVWTEEVARKPVPQKDTWFEVVYRDYLSDRIIGKGEKVE
ncbi:FAD-binding protein [Caproiciproducens sp. NJN-50]|uniref:FAD-dependent oxidoreductase n=1 Tax=Caproiciproducens sp. NJN-50 TaxID=2507162 RepID=UPI000FFE10D8|nr:FAD-binding protein [Caproiciproducens sp. NJN-50]QAT48786.1 FAD-binding protein [Caproiciproducens sp. NJN-50]